MDNSSEATLIFTCDFDPRTEWEAEQKGWFERAVVRLPNGIEVTVSFWDPVRLAQDLETDVSQGRFCFAEPGLIIVPKVTKMYMTEAVKQLFRDNYFDRSLALRDTSK